jgi:hypothetical protein
MLRCTKEERLSAAFEDGRKVEREGVVGGFLCGGNHFWGRRRRQFV